jgi:hypothetical protein
MENPAFWKRAELVISDALEDHATLMSAGLVGPSQISYVANALREAGLLKDHDEDVLGWPALREHAEKRRQLHE